MDVDAFLQFMAGVMIVVLIYGAVKLWRSLGDFRRKDCKK